MLTALTALVVLLVLEVPGVLVVLRVLGVFGVLEVRGMLVLLAVPASRGPGPVGGAVARAVLPPLRVLRGWKQTAAAPERSYA
ncbi:hypothetical protein ACFVH7_36140, partial [Kitasatospora indigofera]|uniref:hypothetical protein n=1 Tax=Kitasatospora indigofera TaxID=67307 RepID=UPI003639A331